MLLHNKISDNKLHLEHTSYHVLEFDLNNTNLKRPEGKVLFQLDELRLIKVRGLPKMSQVAILKLECVSNLLSQQCCVTNKH